MRIKAITITALLISALMAITAIADTKYVNSSNVKIMAVGT